jgi:hypothetical protein
MTLNSLSLSLSLSLYIYIYIYQFTNPDACMHASYDDKANATQIKTGQQNTQAF